MDSSALKLSNRLKSASKCLTRPMCLDMDLSHFKSNSGNLNTTCITKMKSRISIKWRNLSTISSTKCSNKTIWWTVIITISPNIEVLTVETTNSTIEEVAEEEAVEEAKAEVASTRIITNRISSILSRKGVMFRPLLTQTKKQLLKELLNLN